MKGIKIEVENEKPIFWYSKNNVIEAIAHALYYTANPDSEMCIPNCAFECAEKMFDEWVNDTRIKNVIDVLNENIKKRNIELFGDQND